MPEAPVFFIPGVGSSEAEKVLALLAVTCGGFLPDLDKRIYSIAFDHDGEEWTATVGESLCGTKTAVVGKRPLQRLRTMHLSDPATVVAIFPGFPFVVVTNHQRPKSVGSAWNNPFLASNPSRIVYFAKPK